MYREGQGVPQDYTEAVKWFRKAAEQGKVHAQNNLGLMYANGQGVPRDDAEAMKWYRKAAEQGEVRAQNNLGLMYDDGWGVAQDYVQAYMWLDLAAAQRDKTAAKERDIIATKLSPADVSKAQRLAREWMARHQK